MGRYKSNSSHRSHTTPPDSKIPSNLRLTDDQRKIVQALKNKPKKRLSAEEAQCILEVSANLSEMEAALSEHDVSPRTSPLKRPEPVPFSDSVHSYSEDYGPLSDLVQSANKVLLENDQIIAFHTKRLQSGYGSKTPKKPKKDSTHSHLPTKSVSTFAHTGKGKFFT